MDDSDPAGANSAAIDATAVRAAAEEHGADPDDLAALVTVVGSDLTDAHHGYEGRFDHATVGTRRVYAADDEAWTALVKRNDAADLAAALRAAHREQAASLLDDPPAHPVVVGVDTAEEGG
jgi:8-oxo-dGTP pyrophosphatase MutT (NUDIX family)